MNELPPPLVAAEVDVRSFPFMPLHIHRLRTSRAWMRCKRNPALGFYLMNLWTAAWQSRPAGSLEDDPMVLADAAMCTDEAFAELREEMLQGWIRCDDGRLYHPVVVEQALIAWGSKCSRQAQTEAARQAREAKRRAETSNVTENATSSVTETNRHLHLHRHEEERSPSLCSGDRSPAPADRPKEPAAKRSHHPQKPRKHPYPVGAFSTWYAKYPRKQARPAAEKAFHKIEAADDMPFADLLGGIDRFHRVQPDLAFWPHPASWLNNKRWLDEPAASRIGGVGISPGDEPRINFGGGVSWPVSAVLRQVDKWRSDPSSWPEGTLGPPPYALGCKVPDELLRIAA